MLNIIQQYLNQTLGHIAPVRRKIKNKPTGVTPVILINMPVNLNWQQFTDGHYEAQASIGIELVTDLLFDPDEEVQQSTIAEHENMAGQINNLLTDVTIYDLAGNLIAWHWVLTAEAPQNTDGQTLHTTLGFDVILAKHPETRKTTKITPGVDIEYLK
jgi:hypothetical protein